MMIGEIYSCLSLHSRYFNTTANPNNPMQTLGCRYHPHGELIEDYRAGDVICKVCARVVGERMLDVGSEWRDFGSESDSVSRSRVGAAQNLLYGSDNLETMATVLPGARTASRFNQPRQSSSLNQTSSADKALRTAHDAIRAVASRINLTKKVTDRALAVYKTFYDLKCLRGRSLDVNVAACIYIACREEGSTRTIDEIASISTVLPLEISRAYSKLIRFLPKSAPMKSFNIADLMPRFCSRLTLAQPAAIRRAAIHIAERAKDLCDLQGRKPSSIAGAAIYLACSAARENVSKKSIHEATGASELVIRDVYKRMLPHAAQLFPVDFVFQCPIAQLPSV